MIEHDQDVRWWEYAAKRRGRKKPAHIRVAGRSLDGSRLPIHRPSIRKRLKAAAYWEGWKTVGAVATTVVAISTAVIAIRTFQVSERALTANTLQQTSDRFVKAIDQLGSDKLDVRLGGVYGLEQLAHDAPSEQPAVYDVLTAFVRHQVPANTGKCSDPTLHLGSADQSPNASPSADVEAVVDAIARRDVRNDRINQELDLSGTCLVAAPWSILKLAGVVIQSADLRYMVFIHSNFREANLSNSDLTGAKSDDTDLTMAFLINTNFTDAELMADNFTRANLSHAKFNGADLSDADFSGASLRGADFTGANLTGAKLGSAYYDGSTKWPSGFHPL